MSSKRGAKNKHFAPPSQEFLALGGNAPAVSSSQPGLSKLPLKRAESFQPPISIGSPKRPKLNSPLPQVGSMPTASTLVSISQLNRSWEERAITVPALELPVKILQYDTESDSEDMIERILCGAALQLREQKGKPDRCLASALIYLAKIRPLFFCSNVILDAFSSLLKRDSSSQLKGKFNLIPSLVINLFHYAYHDENLWPETFIKLFVEDSLGDRIWVDNEECKEFVNIIIASFKTKLPPKSLLQTSDVLNIANSPSLTLSNMSEDSLGDDASCSSNPSIYSDQSRESGQGSIVSRYAENESFVVNYITEVINDQVGRRTNANDIPRNMLKLMTATAGIKNVRLLVAQKLEMWFQNPKLSRPAQDLLLTVCLNCTEHDADTLSYLTKIRLKSKPFINHFITCLRELLNQTTGTFDMVLRTVLSNELSQIRHMNNFQIISVIFQHDANQATIVLAQILLSYIFQRDDYLRVLRILLREVVRGLRFDHLNYKLFVETLMKESRAFSDKAEFLALDPAIKQRAFQSIIDLITMTLLLLFNPSVREAFSTTKSDRRDIIRNFQMKVANLQSITIEWFQEDFLRKYCVSRDIFESCLKRLLFLEAPDQYCKLDNWPAENERVMIFRFTSEVPLFENTLIGILTMGTKKLISTKDSCEFSCALINRAASIYEGDPKYPVLIFSNVQIVLHLFESCKYYFPENVLFPEGYTPPTMAIIDLYWKVWIQVVIIAAHNPKPFGEFAWEHFPTFRMLIEMAITNHYQFPSRSLGDAYGGKENHCAQLDKYKILELENYLASDQEITENNSYLLSTLITLDPYLPPRKPPSQFLEQLKALCNSVSHRLCHHLCQSRNPDFLLMIIEQQQSCLGLQSFVSPMAWLVELVESHENNYGLLPVQCLCEFLLGQISEEMATTVRQDLTKNELVKKKDKRRKLIRLIHHLQNISLACDVGRLSEVFHCLFSRLSYSQSMTRLLSYKAIQLIVTTSTEECLIKLDEMIIPPLLMVDSNDWFKVNLLKYLRSTAQIEAVCESLDEALAVESDHVMICNYLEFISHHVHHPSKTLITNLSSLLLYQKKISHYILNYSDLDLKNQFLLSYYGIYHKYLTGMLGGKPKSLPEEHLVVKFGSNKICTMNSATIHAIIFSLAAHTYIEPESEAFRFLSDLFLRKPYPVLFRDLEYKQPEPLISEPIVFRLLATASEPIIDLVLDNVKNERIVPLLEQYGLATVAVQRILHNLDKMSAAESKTIKALQFNRPIVLETLQAYWSIGINSGTKFARTHLNHKASATEVADVEMKEASPRRADEKLDRSDSKVASFKKDDIGKIFTGKDYRRMRLLTRQIATELNDSSVKAKKLTKLFLNELNSNIEDLSELFVEHFFDSIFNVIVVASLKDTKRFGFNSEFTSIRKSLLSLEIDNVEDTPLFKCLERFFHKENQKSKRSRVSKKKSSPLKTIDDLTTYLNSLNSNRKLKTPWVEIFKDLAMEKFYNKDTELQDANSSEELKLLIFSRNRSYFLSLLMHKSNFSTLNNCVEFIFNSGLEEEKLNPTTVLDFFTILINFSKLRIGYDTDNQKILTYKDVLKLNYEQMKRLIDFVIAENEISNRIDLIIRSCCATNLKTNITVGLLNTYKNGPHSKAVMEILTRIYVHIPDIEFKLTASDDSETALLFSLPSPMDKLTHNMITSFLDVEQCSGFSKQSFTYLELSLLAIASKHPLLLIRLLPLIPAMLGEKVFSFNYEVFKSLNLLTIFRVLLNMITQLQPFIWNKNSQGLQEIMDLFLGVFLAYRYVSSQKEPNKELLPLLRHFMEFLNDWIRADSESANNWIKINRDNFNKLFRVYKEEEKIFKALCAGIPHSKHLEIMKSSKNFLIKLRTLYWNQETLIATLGEISKLSDSTPELAEYLLDEIRTLYTNPCACDLALAITLKALKRNPNKSTLVLASFLQCFNPENGFVAKSALNLVPQFVLLSQEHRYLIMRRIFELAVAGNVAALPALIESFKAINLQKGC